ncbi:MAG TPA: hypothetical protein VFV99_20070, partial [Kofleriaceae bacterium]|nr:hypothetical protein [Kofleriaceae bacterium]
MWNLGTAWQDELALAAAWRAGQPFPHVIADDFVPRDALPELFAVLDDEAVDRYEGDIFRFEASAVEPATPEFRGLRDEFAAVLAP